jgi:putative ABC transport system substrate-binding protein
MRNHIGRRQFITLLGGAAVAWPLAATAQQQDGRVRRVGWLLPGAEHDPVSRTYIAALQETLAKLGWIEGRNLRIDLRFAADDPDRIRAYAAELVGLAPNVMVTSSGAATRAVQQQTQRIPIIFTTAGDPVANGLVLNIARPEGNITGFSVAEPSIAGKRLELFKEAVPSLTRVAVIFNPETAATALSYISSIEAAAAALGVEAIKIPVRSAVDVVRGIDAFATAPNGGLLVLPPSPFPETIRQLVTQHRLPAIESGQFGARVGSLLEFAADDFDRFRGAASYVDRLLRGAKVSELLVQFPTKVKLVVNLKTAKAIGLTIPEVFLLRADELIE